MILHKDVCWLLCERQGNRTLGKWITKRKNLASEVQKWPLLYDKSDKNYKKKCWWIRRGRKLRRTWEWKVCFCTMVEVQLQLQLHVLKKCQSKTLLNDQTTCPWSSHLLWSLHSKIFSRNIFRVDGPSGPLYSNSISRLLRRRISIFVFVSWVAATWICFVDRETS